MCIKTKPRGRTWWSLSEKPGFTGTAKSGKDKNVEKRKEIKKCWLQQLRKFPGITQQLYVFPSVSPNHLSLPVVTGDW